MAWAWSGFCLLPYLGDLLTQSTTSTDMLGLLGAVTTLPTMLTPMIAVLIMRIFVSKEGLKGYLGLLRSPKYFLAALIAPAVFITAGVLIVQLLGSGEFRWSEATWFVYLMLLVITVPVILFTFGEEYVWRGYLLPRLLPLGEIRASVLGVIWGVAPAADNGQPQLSRRKCLVGHHLHLRYGGALIHLHVILCRLGWQPTGRCGLPRKHQPILRPLLGAATSLGSKPICAERRLRCPDNGPGSRRV